MSEYMPEINENTKMKPVGICIQLAAWIPDEMVHHFVEILTNNPRFQDVVEESLYCALGEMRAVGEMLPAQVVMKVDESVSQVGVSNEF